MLQKIPRLGLSQILKRCDSIVTFLPYKTFYMGKTSLEDLMFAKSILLSVFLILGGCASKREVDKSAHHHHSCKMENCEMKHRCEMFAKKCAMSVAHGDMHIGGMEEFSLVHDGHRYFFSSKEKMEEFKKNINQNVKKAEMHWNRYNGADSRR